MIHLIEWFIGDSFAGPGRNFILGAHALILGAAHTLSPYQILLLASSLNSYFQSLIIQ